MIKQRMLTEDERLELEAKIREMELRLAELEKFRDEFSKRLLGIPCRPPRNVADAGPNNTYIDPDRND